MLFMRLAQKIKVLKLQILVLKILVKRLQIQAKTRAKMMKKSQHSEDGVLMSQDRQKKLDEGKADINGSDVKIQLGDSDVGSFGSKCASFISTVCGVCAKVISNVAKDGGLVYGDGKYSVEQKGIFTINSLVFGEYFMFNSAPYEKSVDVISRRFSIKNS